jgi:8-oxo-dGTP diphosphatase
MHAKSHPSGDELITGGVVQPGKDYIGVGVGAVISDTNDRLFLARRGPASRNEVGMWEFPGGLVEYGEPLERAVLREFFEEYGMVVEVTRQIGALDHILLSEAQHWVSVLYLGRHIGGMPSICEPDKCSEIGWFHIGELPEPLSQITIYSLRKLSD